MVPCAQADSATQWTEHETTANFYFFESTRQKKTRNQIEIINNIARLRDTERISFNKKKNL